MRNHSVVSHNLFWKKMNDEQMLTLVTELATKVIRRQSQSMRSTPLIR